MRRRIQVVRINRFWLHQNSELNVSAVVAKHDIQRDERKPFRLLLRREIEIAERRWLQRQDIFQRGAAAQAALSDGSDFCHGGKSLPGLTASAPKRAQHGFLRPK